MWYSRWVWGALIAAIVGASSLLPAAAQELAPPRSSEDNTPALEVIEVTAQRRTENLQNVPVAVQAFTADTVARAGVSSTDDLAVLAPTLTFGSQTGWAQPRLRGIGTTALGPGIENPVAIYVDGVYYAAMSGGIFDLSNIAAVEIINGPQGTLFGRNATGGLIQVRTRTPSHDFGGNASVSYGDYDTSALEGYVTGGLTEALAADFAMTVRNQGEGYGRNYLTGRDVEKTDDFFLRSKLLFTPTDTTRVTLAADGGQVNSRPVLAPAPGTTPLGGPPYTGPARSYRGFFDAYGRSIQIGGSATIEQDFGPLTLSSISAYRNTHLHNRIDGALVANPAFAQNVEPTLPQQQLSEELQLASRQGSSVTWVLGAYYFHEIAKFDPVHLYGDLLAPVGTILGYSTSRTSSGSLYGQATFDVLSDSHLTLGAREIVERRSIGITENIYLLNGALADQEATRDEKTFDKPTWRIAFDHTFSPGILGYLSYNRGFKSGGFNPLILPAKSFAPEHLDAYEIGLKTSLFGNRLRLNTAVYDYDYKNIQVVSYRRSLLEVANGAAATLYGLDADFELAATDDLTLKAGLSLLRATFDSYPNADITTPAPAGGTLYATGSAQGKHLPFAPAWTFNTGIDYSIPMPFGRALLNMTYLHNAGWYAAPDNRLRQKAYDVLNGRLGWQSPHASYEFSLWIKNILNEDYATTIFSQVRGDVIEYAPPRTFGLTLQKKF